MANPKLKAVPNRYNEAGIEAIDLFSIKLDQANAIIHVLACADTDPSGRPTQEMTALALQACALLDEAQRVIEPMLSSVILLASATADVTVPPSAAPKARSESHPPPDAA
jgi:hypothetical protein